MNENKKEEENKEDNIIININDNDDNNGNEDQNNEYNFETDLLKYKFDYTSKFKSCKLEEKEKNKFILHLFLNSSKINMFNKVILLEKLFELYKQEKNFYMIYNISYKLLKYFKEQRIPLYYLNASTLFNSEFLSSQKNYFYVFKYFNDFKKIININVKNYINDEIQENIILKIKTYQSIFEDVLIKDKIAQLKEVINNIFEKNKSKSKEKGKNKIKNNENQDKKITKIGEDGNNSEKFKNINEIEINSINDNNIKENNNLINDNTIKSEEIIKNGTIIDNENNNKLQNKNSKKEINKNNEKEESTKGSSINSSTLSKIVSNYIMEESPESQKENEKYLYAINKAWLENAKLFINSYFFAKEINSLAQFFNDSFNINYVYRYYLFDEKIKTLPENHEFYPFPGPINNLRLSVYKDIWIDPINSEENDIIDKNLILGKDYYYINYKEWIILQNSFSSTNEIKRKKDNIEMTQLGVFVFDQRFKKNNNITSLLNKKVIQIRKNASISDFYQKILICVDHALNEQKNINSDNSNKTISDIKNGKNIDNKFENINSIDNDDIKTKIESHSSSNKDKNKPNNNDIKDINSIEDETTENTININSDDNNIIINQDINKTNEDRKKDEVNKNLNIINENNNNNNYININNNDILEEDNINKIEANKNIIGDKELLFYKVKKDNRDIIIEMQICFVNDIPSYESVFINEIKFSKDDNIQEIFKKFNPKKELLIIEIADKKSNNQFLHQIKPIPNSGQTYSCSICNHKIRDLNDTKYTCEICSMYLFCDKICGRKNDCEKGIQHQKLNSLLSELILSQEFNFPKFLSKKFNPDKCNNNKNKNRGVAGLYNLGNTCYINCSLQCLSHTKDLTKYFLNYCFQNEINLTNTFGTNGILVKIYSDMINQLWLSNINKINPIFFRVAFSQSTRKFLNNYQQDAMEFLSIFLNSLHEDLNRVSEKPYLQLDKHKKGESEYEESQRFWNYHILRENSIIVDLFHGQFKNIIKCLVCGNITRNYEPFINITLPIPEKHNFYVFKFFNDSNCKNIIINANSETIVDNLIEKSREFLNKEILESVKKMDGKESFKKLLLNNCIEIVKLNKDKLISNVYTQENDNLLQEFYKRKLLSFVGGEEEIVIFEKKIIPDYHRNIYVYPIMTDYKNNDKVAILSYPVVFSVKDNMTIENLENLILSRFIDIIDSKKVTKDDCIIDLNIFHSIINLNKGFLSVVKQYKDCPFCRQSYATKKFCPLYRYFNKSDNISKIFKYVKDDLLILLARSFYFDKTKKVYPDFNFEENNYINKNRNIYDSFNLFGSEEVLGENNLLSCQICRRRTKISKAIRINRPPNYLIIQLKRFKKKSENFFSIFEDDKNSTFVYFPKKNLDLSSYIDGKENIKACYNLYAIINHTNEECNHFTSICRNNNRWIEFNDSKLYETNNPITKDAYILFYVKKEIDK